MKRSPRTASTSTVGTRDFARKTIEPQSIRFILGSSHLQVIMAKQLKSPRTVIPRWDGPCCPGARILTGTISAISSWRGRHIRIQRYRIFFPKKHERRLREDPDLLSYRNSSILIIYLFKFLVAMMELRRSSLTNGLLQLNSQKSSVP